MDAPTAELLVDGHAEKAVSARLGEQFALYHPVGLPLVVLRDNTPLQEGSEALPERLVLIAENGTTCRSLIIHTCTIHCIWTCYLPPRAVPRPITTSASERRDPVGTNG